MLIPDSNFIENSF